jgi:plastocyanin
VDWTAFPESTIFIQGPRADFRDIRRNALAFLQTNADMQKQRVAMTEIPITRSFRFVVMVLLIVAGFAIPGAVPARAERIEGTIVIRKKLTKRRVTAQVPMYQRGPAVELSADTEEDPLAFERSRVAVYLEGSYPAGSHPEGASTAEKPGEKPMLKPGEKPMLKMEQTNRRFSPEMLVIQAGSRVSFPNNDPIFHNVFSLSGPRTFDLGNYPKGDTRVVAFPDPGIVYVNCHLHPNMTATIVVAPNKWNTQADRDGQFVLQDVPPGEYTIVAWHKAAGFFRQTEVVVSGRNQRVEFLIPIDENGRTIESRKSAAKRGD